MAPTKNNIASSKELQKEREQKIEDLEIEIELKSYEKEFAFNMYQEKRAAEKRLESELNLIKNGFEEDKNEINDKEGYLKPDKDEIQEVVQSIVDGVMTRSEGAASLGIRYSTMCRHVQNTGIKVPSHYYHLPEV
jgi:Glu-tRNA(Gln) amidotransferase subunit E-like FAD-binding protein